MTSIICKTIISRRCNDQKYRKYCNDMIIFNAEEEEKKPVKKICNYINERANAIIYNDI